MLDAISTKELFAKNYAISGSISMSSDYFTDIMDGVVDGNLYGHTL